MMCIYIINIRINDDTFEGQDKLVGKIKGYWNRFDNFVMKPFFIDDWPNVKRDHDEISLKIITVFDDHQKKKIKNKELKDIVSRSSSGAERMVSLLEENQSVKRRKSEPKKLNKI